MASPPHGNDVRVLYRPGRETPQPGNALPLGASKAAHDARLELGTYMDATLLRPLFATAEQHESGIELALETMTMQQRVLIEIEKSQRERSVHTSDYDPLK